MAKLKTNSGAKKRFTLTGSGKIKRKHAYHSHILTKKTKKRPLRAHPRCRREESKGNVGSLKVLNYA